MGAATPTLAEFREFRHVAAKRVPDPETVKETEASNDELERFSQLLSTLTPSRVRFLYRQRWDVLRLDPGGIPHLADASSWRGPCESSIPGTDKMSMLIDASGAGRLARNPNGTLDAHGLCVKPGFPFWRSDQGLYTACAS